MKERGRYAAADSTIEAVININNINLIYCFLYQLEDKKKTKLNKASNSSPVLVMLVLQTTHLHIRPR